MRAPVITFDSDGRLRVPPTRVAKSGVFPYFGREVENFARQNLGLQSDGVFWIVRRPFTRDLARQFNGIPIRRKHSYDDADVIGQLGCDARLEGRFVTKSLVIWDRDAIDEILAGKKTHLSAGHRDVHGAVMTPGTLGNQHYDGIVIGGVPDHITLCAEGRVGPECAIQINRRTQNDTPYAKPQRHKFQPHVYSQRQSQSAWSV
jgi:hypothetical protein